MLAEHGLFGILAIAILVWMLISRYAANRPGLSRAMTAAFAVWAMSIMAHSALRLAVIPVTLALGMVMWRLQWQLKDKASETSEAIVTAGQPFVG